MTALDAVNDLVAGKQVKIPVQYIPMIEYGLNNRPGSYEIDVEIRGKWATLTPKGQDAIRPYALHGRFRDHMPPADHIADAVAAGVELDAEWLAEIEQLRTQEADGDTRT